MLTYNLLEYGNNYRKTTVSFWNYYRDEPSNPFFLILNLLITRQVLQEILDDGEAGYDADKVCKNETEILVPLKHLSNFWRTLNVLLINCEIELVLTWSKNYALADMTVRGAGNNNDPPATVAPTGLEFQITNTKLHVPIVILSKKWQKTFRTIKIRI